MGFLLCTNLSYRFILLGVLSFSADLVTYMCRNADTLKRLQDTEKLLKERTEEAYVNLDVSNEEKEKGNQVSS